MRRLSGALLLGVLLGFTLAVMATGAFAHGADLNLIHACVKHGDLRIITPSETCKPKETPLDWPKTGSSGLVVKDANGVVLGPYDFDAFRGEEGVFLSSPHGPVRTRVDRTGFTNQATGFVYTSINCTGPKLANFSSPLRLVPDQNQIGIRAGILYFPPISGTTADFNSTDASPITPASCTSGPGFIAVFIPPDVCCFSGFGPFTDTFGPPGTLDISGFVPPFHVEVAP